MEIDNVIYRKMTDREKASIKKIINRAEKRDHVPIYTHKWLVDYLFEMFKEFNYEEKKDCEDMLNVIIDIGKKFNVLTEKEIKEQKQYINKYINSLFEDEEKEEKFDV